MSRSLFKKNVENEEENDDVWDDTALIRMYEASVSAATRKSTKSSSSKSQQQKWSVGDRCLAPFYEDEQWYPAEIVAIDGDSAEVLFDGYGNQELVKTSDLASEDLYVPEGETSDDRKPCDVADNSNAARNITKTFVPPVTSGVPQTLPQLAPPPPPALSGLVPPDEMEALSSMLMSWYMSGYHTGYYQCMNDLKKQHKK